MMRRFISKYLAVAALLPGIAGAELNTFSPGDPIRSAEMNANFELLLSEIDSLRARVEELEAAPAGEGKVACTRSSLEGQWLAATVDSLNDYELNTAIFRANGTVSFTAETELLGFERGEGTYSIRSDCYIEATGTFSLGSVDYFGWLSDDGNTIRGLIYRRVDGLWFAPTLSRYNR